MKKYSTKKLLTCILSSALLLSCFPHMVRAEGDNPAEEQIVEEQTVKITEESEDPEKALKEDPEGAVPEDENLEDTPAEEQEDPEASAEDNGTQEQEVEDPEEGKPDDERQPEEAPVEEGTEIPEENIEDGENPAKEPAENPEEVPELSEAVPEEGDIEINAEHFPDKAFRDYLLGKAIEDFGIDRDQDGFLSHDEREVVTMLDVREEYLHGSIKSLEGIQYFKNVEILVCYGNELTELDLSELTELRILSCSKNRLSTLDLRANEKLETVACEYNRISQLLLYDEDIQVYAEGNKL